MEEVNFDEKVFEKLTEWKEAALQQASVILLSFLVAVDNGATNTRIAFGTETEFVLAAKFKCKSVKTLVESLTHIGEELRAKIGEPSSYVVSGVFASAGRLLDGATRVHITNYHEGDENQYLSLLDLPSTLFPVGRSRILNDLESACFGIAGLNKLGQLRDFFNVFYRRVGSTDISSLSPDNCSFFFSDLVIAAGTGMGVGFLVAPKAGGDFSVIPLEGGHILMSSFGPSHPRFAEEQSLFEFTKANIRWSTKIS